MITGVQLVVADAVVRPFQRRVGRRVGWGYALVSCGLVRRPRLLFARNIALGVEKIDVVGVHLETHPTAPYIGGCRTQLKKRAAGLNARYAEFAPFVAEAREGAHQQRPDAGVPRRRWGPLWEGVGLARPAVTIRPDGRAQT